MQHKTVPIHNGEMNKQGRVRSVHSCACPLCRMPVSLPSSRLCRKRGGSAAIFGVIVVAYFLTTTYLSNIVVVANSSKDKPTLQHRPSLPSSLDNDTTADLRPKLSSILDLHSGQLIGDPQFLLDFAVVGHGKCGTTSLQDWLGEHPEIRSPPEEMHDLTLGTPDRFVYRLYTELPPGPYKRGYKSPGEIRSARSLRLLSKLFPKTLLIIGIRHPVLWFESLYNFKVQNLRPELPSNYFGDPNRLIGKCPTFLDFNCVGTAKGLFHVHLAHLGKTTQTEELEQRYPNLKGNITQTRNPIFLFDVEQLSPRENDDDNTAYNSTRLIDTLRQDLQTALGLKLPLPPPPKKRPGKILKQKKIQKSRDRHKIQICKAKYEPVRMELMRIAREASDWIRNSGFLDHPDVTVSSRHYFENVILKGHWEKDPCDNFEPGKAQN